MFSMVATMCARVPRINSRRYLRPIFSRGLGAGRPSTICFINQIVLVLEADDVVADRRAHPVRALALAPHKVVEGVDRRDVGGDEPRLQPLAARARPREADERRGGAVFVPLAARPPDGARPVRRS